MKQQNYKQYVDMIKKIGCTVDYITDNIIWIDDGMLVIAIGEEEPNEVSIDFCTEIAPSVAATIALKLSELLNNINMKLVVYGDFSYELNKNNETELVWVE